MLLARLLEALFGQGVTLVATSNSAPHDLYRGGLQRQRFLPAIDLIRQHTEVVHVDGLTDYRLRVLEAAEIWHAPLDPMTDGNLEQYFRNMAPDRGTEGESLDVLGRTITTRRRAEGIAWFHVYAPCAGPRRQEDVRAKARQDYGDARTARLLDRSQGFLFGYLELRSRWGDPANLPI